MNPLRWDVLLAGFVLSLPVLALGVRGDLTFEEMAIRVLWCMAAGWGAVALLRVASAPRATPVSKTRHAARRAKPSEDSEPSRAP